jgi:hypothetical protein
MGEPGLGQDPGAAVVDQEEQPLGVPPHEDAGDGLFDLPPSVVGLDPVVERGHRKVVPDPAQRQGCWGWT